MMVNFHYGRISPDSSEIFSFISAVLYHKTQLTNKKSDVRFFHADVAFEKI